MDLMAIRYIVLVVAVCIFLWAAIETYVRIRRRQQQKKVTHSRWVRLDTVSPLDHQVVPRSSFDDDSDDDQEEQRPEQNLHLRAQQNGHHSFESKHPL